MRSLVIDTGTIISLVTNNLLWILEPLKKQFRGNFYISKEVKSEIIDHPLETRKFKLEGLMVQELMNKGVISLYDGKITKNRVEQLLSLANNSFIADNHPIKLVDKAEIETLALVLEINANAIVIDERTLRLLIEDPEKLRGVLSSRLHTKVNINKDNLSKFNKLTSNVRIIRSTELAYIAYKLGELNKYISKTADKKLKKDLLEGTLWALKLKGCSISEHEIDRIISMD